MESTEGDLRYIYRTFSETQENGLEARIVRKVLQQFKGTWTDVPTIDHLPKEGV